MLNLFPLSLTAEVLIMLEMSDGYVNGVFYKMWPITCRLPRYQNTCWLIAHGIAVLSTFLPMKLVSVDSAGVSV